MLKANAPLLDRVVPHDHLLQALWGPGHPGHPGPVRTVVKNLRRKLGEGAHKTPPTSSTSPASATACRGLEPPYSGPCRGRGPPLVSAPAPRRAAPTPGRRWRAWWLSRPSWPGFGLFQSLCRHATQSPHLSVQNGLLETFRGICPPRHPGRLSGPPELPPGALGSCRQRFFPGLHVPAETFLFPYAGFVGVKLCTELPTVFSDEGGGRSRLGVDPGEACCQRTAGKPASNCRKTARKPLENPRQNRWKTGGKTAGKPPAKPLENRRQNRWKTGGKTAGKPPAKPPENCRKTTGKTVGKPPENPRQNRWKTAGDHWQNCWETVGKTAGKPLGDHGQKLSENCREKPRFWVTFASLNKQLEWPGRASPASFFGPWGGVAIRDPLFRRNLCTLRSDGVGGTGIFGFLDVREGILGPMTAFAGFHDKATPKGVYTSSYAPFRGGAYPLAVKENSHDLAITDVTFDPTPFWAFGPVSISPCGGGEKACWTLMKERALAGAVWTFCWSSWGLMLCPRLWIRPRKPGRPARSPASGG